MVSIEPLRHAYTTRWPCQRTAPPNGGMGSERKPGLVETTEMNFLATGRLRFGLHVSRVPHRVQTRERSLRYPKGRVHLGSMIPTPCVQSPCTGLLEWMNPGWRICTTNDNESRRYFPTSASGLVRAFSPPGMVPRQESTQTVPTRCRKISYKC